MSEKRVIVNWCDKIKPCQMQMFDDVKSVTDQRAILTTPEGAVNQFLVPDDVMEELENETLDMFDKDILDYDERAELGEDIATAKSLPPIKTKSNRS